MAGLTPVDHRYCALSLDPFDEARRWIDEHKRNNFVSNQTNLIVLWTKYYIALIGDFATDFAFHIKQNNIRLDAVKTYSTQDGDVVSVKWNDDMIDPWWKDFLPYLDELLGFSHTDTFWDSYPFNWVDMFVARIHSAEDK